MSGKSAESAPSAKPEQSHMPNVPSERPRCGVAGVMFWALGPDGSLCARTGASGSPKLVAVSADGWRAARAQLAQIWADGMKALGPAAAPRRSRPSRLAPVVLVVAGKARAQVDARKAGKALRWVSPPLSEPQMALLSRLWASVAAPAPVEVWKEAAAAKAAPEAPKST